MNLKKHRYFLSLIVLLCLPLILFAPSGLPVTHDGQDHVARIANFYQNLEQGNLIPRWAPNLNWGYGHPILMFLYPLPSYIASVFKYIGFSFVDSTKLVFASAYLLSGITMYLWIKKTFDERTGILASLLYVYAPYRFVDMYVRGAIGEHVAFIFPPLICYFLFLLHKRFSYKYIVGIVFSVAGLILAHNAISLMMLPLICLYIIYLVLQTKNKKTFAVNSLLSIISGFGLSAFFWIPAFFEGKYTLRDIVTSEDYATRFVSLGDFFYKPWSFGGTYTLSKEVGFIHWLLLLFAILILFRMKQKKKKLFLAYCIGIFLFTLFLMTNYSKFIWDSISTLRKFQFPWRFLTVIVSISSVIGSFTFSAVAKKHQEKVFALIIVLLLATSIRYIVVDGYLHKDESFYSGIYKSTTDTGESSPIWSVRFMEREPKAPIEILSGKANISIEKRNTTVHTYVIKADTSTRIRENTLYFPGWIVLVDKKQVPIQFQDPSSRGLITFWLEPGKHSIEMVFTDTKLRFIAMCITYATVTFLLLWFIIIRTCIWQRFR